LMALALAMFLRFETSLIEMGLLFVCDRIYTCSFMSTLNSRDSLRRKIEKISIVPPLTSVHDSAITSQTALRATTAGNNVFSPRSAREVDRNYLSPTRVTV